MKRGCLIVGITLLFFVFLFGGAGIYVLARYEAPGLAKASFVEIPLGGPLPDYSHVENLFGDAPVSMRDLLDVLELARTEPRVEGIVLRITPMGAGWGKVREIRDAVERVRDAGKTVVAYIEVGGDQEYYLATAADRIVIAPMTTLAVDGISMELTFFRGALDKVGVTYDGVAVGEYKSAPEHYTRKGMSREYREEMAAIADGLFDAYVEAIATARAMSVNEVKALVDDPPFDAVRSKEKGLVDDVLYWDEFAAWVKDQGQGRRASITPASRLRERATRAREGSFTWNKIAVVYVQGGIRSGESDNGGVLGGASAGDYTFSRTMEEIRRDSKIRAVVVRVDSPGGSVLASDNMWREIIVTRQQKPVVVSMGDVAASGGYYIAAAADAVVAQPQTITGSIGIFTGKWVLSGLYDKVGVTTDGLKRGEQADLYSSGRTFNAKERAKIQEELDSLYEVFVRKVAEGRMMDVDRAMEIAEGRVWLGVDGLANGLVDELGGLETAVRVARDRAGIPLNADVGVHAFPRRRRFFDEYLGSDTWAKSLPPTVVETAKKATMPPYRDGEPLALMPFHIDAN